MNASLKYVLILFSTFYVIVSCRSHFSNFEDVVISTGNLIAIKDTNTIDYNKLPINFHFYRGEDASAQLFTFHENHFVIDLVKSGDESKAKLGLNMWHNFYIFNNEGVLKDSIQFYSHEIVRTLFLNDKMVISWFDVLTFPEIESNNKDLDKILDESVQLTENNVVYNFKNSSWENNIVNISTTQRFVFLNLQMFNYRIPMNLYRIPQVAINTTRLYEDKSIDYLSEKYSFLLEDNSCSFMINECSYACDSPFYNTRNFSQTTLLPNIAKGALNFSYQVTTLQEKFIAQKMKESQFTCCGLKLNSTILTSDKRNEIVFSNESDNKMLTAAIRNDKFLSFFSSPIYGEIADSTTWFNILRLNDSKSNQKLKRILFKGQPNTMNLNNIIFKPEVGLLSNDLPFLIGTTQAEGYLQNIFLLFDEEVNLKKAYLLPDNILIKECNRTRSHSNESVLLSIANQTNLIDSDNFLILKNNEITKLDISRPKNQTFFSTISDEQMSFFLQNKDGLCEIKTIKID